MRSLFVVPFVVSIGVAGCSGGGSPPANGATSTTPDDGPRSCKHMLTGGIWRHPPSPAFSSFRADARARLHVLLDKRTRFESERMVELDPDSGAAIRALPYATSDFDGRSCLVTLVEGGRRAQMTLFFDGPHAMRTVAVEGVATRTPPIPPNAGWHIHYWERVAD